MQTVPLVCANGEIIPPVGMYPDSEIGEIVVTDTGLLEKCSPCYFCKSKSSIYIESGNPSWDDGGFVQRIGCLCDECDDGSDKYRTEFCVPEYVVIAWNAMQINVRDEKELAQWRDLGARLYPYVRPWGFCGGHPDALKALEDLANLLGIDAQKTVDTNVEQLTRQRTIQEVITMFREKFGRKTLGRYADEYVEHLEQM
jgi:hypothetical protein